MHPTVPGLKDEKYLRNRIKNSQIKEILCISMLKTLLLSLTKFNNSINSGLKKMLIKVFRTHRPLQVTSAWRACRLLPLQRLSWATRPLLLSMSSSRRSSCAVGAASGSAAPSPLAAPPAPPSMKTWPPPGGARPPHVSSPPPGPPPTAGREAMQAEVGTGGVCQGFWAARTGRTEKSLGSSSGSEKVTPCCFPDVESQFHCLVVNQIH